MRILTLTILIGALHASAATTAQTITLSSNNITVEQFFHQLKKQTGYSFLLEAGIVSADQKLSVHVTNATFEQVLDQTLKPLSLSWRLDDKIVYILRQSTTAFQSVNTARLPPPYPIIRGRIVDSLGLPLEGATVQVKGTKTIVATDKHGDFEIKNVDQSAVLVISYIGYETKEVAVGDVDHQTIVLSPARKEAEQVVITAFGIKRQERSLPYELQQINGDQLNQVKQTNVMNSLSGKVAGLAILPSASGVGGSVKVRLRGSRSLAGNNQPLYVIDGVPMLNTGNGKSEIANFTGQSYFDPGDGISNLNPDDIASISVLQGANAAALYGSQAQNGVILITTKKGENGKMAIGFTSSLQSSHIAYKPQFQNRYGATVPSSGDYGSWGADTVKKAYDDVDAFLRTGVNFTNAVNLSGGSKNAQTYFSYANTHATGVQPANSLNRNNFNFRESAAFLDGKLTTDASINYINQRKNNAPNIGATGNPLASVYLFPRGVDIRPYKRYALPDSGIVTNLNWINIPGQDLGLGNPWWTVHNPSSDILNRWVATATIKYTFAPWLNIQVRGNLDRVTDNYTALGYADTIGIATAISGHSSGAFNVSTQTVTQKYGEVTGNFRIPLQNHDFSVDGLVATSITDNQTSGISAGGSLWVPDFFSLANVWTRLVNPNSASANIVTGPQFLTATTPNTNHSQLQSVFGAVNASYKNWLYLSVTGRNDWSSLLAFARTDHFFYPSAGLSFVLSQVVKLPNVISFAKLRASYAQVGNTVPQIYLTNPQNSSNGGSLSFNTIASPAGFKPEKTKSLEAGADLRFLSDRLSLNVTYYKTNTLNQAFNINQGFTPLYSSAWINSGNIQNTGINFTLGYDVYRDGKLTWNTTFNGSTVRNKILSLYQITPGKNAAYGYAPFFHLNVGGSFGDVYGTNVARDQTGRMEVSGDGSPSNPYLPVGSNPDSTYLGNVTPKFQLGWQNSFTYGNFYLSFLIDGSFGGKVWSYTQAFLDRYGDSKKTGDERAQGGIKINGVDAGGKAVSLIPASNMESWYANLASSNVNSGLMNYPGQYMYTATAVRLRELSLGYNFKVNKSFAKSIRLLVTGHNLFFFTRKAPFDPELALATQQNGFSGVDVFSQPSTRDIGLNLNINF